MTDQAWADMDKLNERISELERVLRFEIVGWREHDRREGQSPLDYVVEAALAALGENDG